MKYIKVLLIGIFTFFISINIVDASTKTYTRTKDNPLVPEGIEVNNTNIGEILNTPAVSPAEKVYDYADLYTKEQEEFIYQKLNGYSNDSTIDAIVITTRDLKGLSIEKYANNFYKYNDFKVQGVVFIISLETSEPRIYMGNIGREDSEVFNLYTDERINQILEYLYKDIKIRNYFIATDNYIRILDGFYKLDRKGNYRLNSTGNIVRIVPWFEVSVLSVTLTFIIIILLSYTLGSKNKLAYSYDNNINSSTMMIKTIEEDLIDTKIGKER